MLKFIKIQQLKCNRCNNKKEKHILIYTLHKIFFTELIIIYTSGNVFIYNCKGTYLSDFSYKRSLKDFISWLTIQK
jgi:hypothetical protein